MWSWLPMLALVAGCGSRGKSPDPGTRTTDSATDVPTPTTDSALPPRPANVILLLADDLGVEDTSLHPSGRFPTPQLERLAAQGVVFDQAYAAASVCGPARAALLTGRPAQAWGFEYNNGPWSRDVGEQLGLDPQALTAGDRFAAGGYATPYLGKWHLGGDDAFYPMNRGYSSFFGVLAGATPYIDTAVDGVVMAEVPPSVSDDGDVVGFNQTRRTGGMALVEGPDRVVVDDFERYFTEVLAERAVAELRPDAQPFLLTVAFTAPHTPLQVTAPYHDRFAHLDDPVLRVYAGMVAALDDAVGAILDGLDAAGLSDDTLVIFTSDNGCAGATGVCSCDTVRGSKGTFLDGGTRVPLVIRWPAGMEAGRCDAVVSALDVLPTALSAAGLDVGDLPGRDLTSGCAPTTATLAWRATPHAALRVAAHKLVVDRAAGTTSLYDLDTDPRETTDLSTTSPETVDALTRGLEAWEAAVSEPAWDAGYVGTTSACDETYRVAL